MLGVACSRTWSVDPSTALAAISVAPKVSDDAPGTGRRRRCPPLKAAGVLPTSASVEVEGACRLEVIARSLNEVGKVAEDKSKVGLSRRLERVSDGKVNPEADSFEGDSSLSANRGPYLPVEKPWGFRNFCHYL